MYHWRLLRAIILAVLLFITSLIIFTRMGIVGKKWDRMDHRPLRTYRTTIPKNVDKQVCGQPKLVRNIYSRNISGWKLNMDVCGDCYNLIKSELRTPFGKTPIYIYKAINDIYISKDIIRHGIFDNHKILMVLRLLKSDKSLDLIDIGANIGVFSLSAAKLGRKVLSIDALKSNIQRLCFSVREGGFEKNVTIVYNAVAEKSGMTVKLGVQANNMGGTFIDDKSENIIKVKKEFKATVGGSHGNVSTVILDEVLELEEIKTFKNVVVKIDIEGFEDRVLLGATKFFDTFNIRGIFMEWVFHRKAESGKTIIDFMTKRNFKPFTEDGEQLLSIKSRSSWPLDVLWLQIK